MEAWNSGKDPSLSCTTFEIKLNLIELESLFQIGL